MEVQVSFPGMRQFLSYNCADTVAIGDAVIVSEGVREGMIGTVVALKRGSFNGPLYRCECASEGTVSGRERNQNRVVKQRLSA